MQTQSARVLEAIELYNKKHGGKIMNQVQLAMKVWPEKEYEQAGQRMHHLLFKGRPWNLDWLRSIAKILEVDYNFLLDLEAHEQTN
ncbi:MAG: hypothetical protein HRT61_00755 [Ekhidna sp.]|nr:hypothetical protein [Ekhidna sp.]